MASKNLNEEEQGVSENTEFDCFEMLYSSEYYFFFNI